MQHDDVMVRPGVEDEDDVVAATKGSKFGPEGSKNA